MRDLRTCALATILTLCCFLSGCSGWARDATRAGIENAKSWYATGGGREMIRAEGKALMEEGQALMLAKGREYTDAQVAKLSQAFAGHGVDASKIDSIAAGIAAVKAVQDEEKRSGKPYSPVTGSLITDVIAAYLASKAGLRGAAMLGTRKAEPVPPPRA